MIKFKNFCKGVQGKKLFIKSFSPAKFSIIFGNALAFKAFCSMCLLYKK